MDHPLDMAMRRMAQSKLNVLPVVGREDIRDLKGVVSLSDILQAYGVKEKKGQAQAASKEIRASRRLVPGVIAAGLAVVLVIGFLNYYYRSARIAARPGILQYRQRVPAAGPRRRSGAAVPRCAIGGAGERAVPAGPGTRLSQGRSSGGGFGLFECAVEARPGECACESRRRRASRRRSARPPMP